MLGWKSEVKAEGRPQRRSKVSHAREWVPDFPRVEGSGATDWGESRVGQGERSRVA